MKKKQINEISIGLFKNNNTPKQGIILMMILLNFDLETSNKYVVLHHKMIITEKEVTFDF